MLHYFPQHVSSINMPIFERTNCIITASGIVALCKRLYRMPVESGLQSSLFSSGSHLCTGWLWACEFQSILATNSDYLPEH